MTGNDDMAANGNGTFDPLAQYARLSERVENQGKDLIDLRSNMNTGFQNVNANINALANDFRSNSKTQWPVIWAAAGVCFTVLVTIGTFFYSTISKDQQRLDSALVKITENFVPQKEMEWRAARGSEDRTRTEAAIRDIRDGLVPRQEHERVWTAYDQRLADHQRQLDEIKQAQGNVYGARDFLLELRERQERLERIVQERPTS
jgi:hypothetical protein